MQFKPDHIELQISSASQAWSLLNEKLPDFKKLYAIWHPWYLEKTKNSTLQNVIIDAVVICYARMALRNGSLSELPRNYHSEKHIEDLLYRLMAVSNLTESQSIPGYGWSLLSLFMSAHDLRQSEKSHELGLVGNNELASYEEVIRVIAAIDKNNVIRIEHKQLLKLMIHGSTFGQGEDINGNIFKGNVVEHILGKVGYFESTDKEIAFLACDIDTANVASSLPHYAESSMNVYNEIQTISNAKISAQLFFGKLQEEYFFEYQQFNSTLGKLTFSKQKEENAPKIKQISRKIINLESGIPNQEVIDYYLSLINQLK